jgi:MFS family permease
MTITGMGVLAFAIIAPALPDLADDLGVSRGSIGLVQGAVAIPGIFLAPYIGYLADRYGRRGVIRVSLVIFGVAGTSCFFANDYWLLVALRVLQGLGTSGLLSLGVVVVGDLFVGLERRWAMGINLAAITITTTVAPILGGFLAEGGTFRPFLVFVAAFPVSVWARRLPDRPDLPVPAPPMQHLREAMGVLRERGRLSDYLGMLPTSFVTLGIFLGLGLTVTPLFMERAFGLSASERGSVQAIGSGAHGGGVHRHRERAEPLVRGAGAGGAGPGNGVDLPAPPGLCGLGGPGSVPGSDGGHMGLGQPAGTDARPHIRCRARQRDWRSHLLLRRCDRHGGRGRRLATGAGSGQGDMGASHRAGRRVGSIVLGRGDHLPGVAVPLR